MLEPRLLLTTVAVLAPLVAAPVVARRKDGRSVSVTAAAISLVAIAVAVWFTAPAGGLLTVDSLAAAPALAFAFVMFGLFLTAPKNDVAGGECARLLICLSGTLALYCSESMILALAGFAVSAVPLMGRQSDSLGDDPVRPYAQPRIMLALSTALLASGLFVFATSDNNSHIWAFALVTTAALMRSGIFPFHSWLITACEQPNPLPFAALISGQAGAFVIARLALPLFPEAAQAALPVVSNITLIGTLFAAFLTLGERAPRRILALLIASQSGFVLSGLEMRNVQGITGSLVQWIVMAFTSSGLLLILRCVEVRFGDLVNHPFAGLGARVPRLAAFFLILGLGLVGIPGTLGFCSEDLLFHGALEAHPLLGVALPLATALCAITVLRLFFSLFRGRRALAVPVMADVLPRERWFLLAVVLFLVVAGMVPRDIVASRVGPADSISSILTNKSTAKQIASHGDAR
jgi:NADH-quinone oxidoreductase subunit M